jgi:hypothetical protein
VPLIGAGESARRETGATPAALRPQGSKGEAMTGVDSVDELLNLRLVMALPDGSRVVAVTIEGLDIYVRRNHNGSELAVSVGIDDLPDHVSAVVESNDGMSWEQRLP